MPQSRFEFFALLELVIQRGRVVLEATTTAFLRFEHGDIGRFDQFLSGQARIGIHRNADARRRIHFAAADLVFL